MSCSISTDIAWENFISNNYQNIDIDGECIKEKNLVIPKPSKIYISTQTKIAYFNQHISLYELFWKVPIIPYQTRENGIIKKQIKINCLTPEDVVNLEKIIAKTTMINVDIIAQVNNPHARKVKFKDIRKINVGLCKKELLCLRKKKKGAFYNCFVVILRLQYKGIFKEVHIKVFNTGKLEIPGIQEEEFMILALDYLIHTLQPFLTKKLTYCKENIRNVLINSNFSANYFIDRNKFCNILKYKYNIHTMFDPCSYPGIQCKFYYNEIHAEQNGVCKCNHRCDKKGSGKSTNSCLEVSFMIFRTGSILIVGNCSKAILSIIYSFLVDILRREFKEIQIKGEPKKVKKKKKLRKQIIYIKI